MARAGCALLVASVTVAAQGGRTPSDTAPDTSPVAPLLREARTRLAAGDTTAALELLERATDRAPNDPDALYARSTLLLATTELGVNDALRQFIASRLLTRAASLEPRNPRHLLALGRLRLRTPLLRVEAERMFRRALDVARNQDDPAQFLIVEQWDTRADYEAYLAWRAERGDMEIFGAMMAGPPTIRFFDFVGL